MEKRLKDYKWSLQRKISEALSDIDIIISPINTIKTIKIIELANICEFVNYSKGYNDLSRVYLELKEYLHSYKSLILNASKICPGVDTSLLNAMTLELLSDELTEEEKMILSSKVTYLERNNRVLKRIK